MIAAARVILSVWKEPSQPEFNRWKENMLKIVSYERFLARINDDTEGFDKSWGRVFD